MTGQNSASGLEHPRPDPDAEYLLALRQGSEREKSQALSALMDRHLKSIKSLAWHMMGDEMIAEDIAQETFLKAWTQAANWEPGRAKFSTWLHRVAKNDCFDRLRKKREIYSDDVPEIEDDGPNAAQVMMSDETQNTQKHYVEKALKKLPERQLAAITLCHYQNKSQIEAAEILDIGVRAYESLLARARRNLRGELDGLQTELLGERT
ncbi:MAG: RNA polymerase sigma factor [Hyphomonadaceae bacterium]|nr:RNA polymerase sigma factor [Hyphomonadaceae bacterium]